VDSAYILSLSLSFLFYFYFYFVSISVRNLFSFKLSQHAQNLDPGERDKQENRIMIIGWGSDNR